jgi:hypothetical protein
MTPPRDGDCKQEEEYSSHTSWELSHSTLLLIIFLDYAPLPFPSAYDIRSPLARVKFKVHTPLPSFPRYYIHLL